MTCGCQTPTAAATGGVTMTTRVANNPGLGVFAPLAVDARNPGGAVITPATAEAQNTALAQNLGQTAAPAAKEKTSGWWVAALAAGALAFL